MPYLTRSIIHSNSNVGLFNTIEEASLFIVAENGIITGNGIADSLSQSMDFPRLLVRMVSVGENSGRLPEVLDKIADMYEDQVETDLTTAMGLFEPIVISVFGGFILVLVLAVYIPIFTLSSHV